MTVVAGVVETSGGLVHLPPGTKQAFSSIRAVSRQYLRLEHIRNLLCLQERKHGDQRLHSIYRRLLTKSCILFRRFMSPLLNFLFLHRFLSGSIGHKRLSLKRFLLHKSLCLHLRVLVCRHLLAQFDH